MVVDLGARAILRARTLLAHVGKVDAHNRRRDRQRRSGRYGGWRSGYGASVVAVSALLAVLAARVMHTVALARVRVARVRVVVARARHAASEHAAVGRLTSVAGRAPFAVLTRVTRRALTHLDERGRFYPNRTETQQIRVSKVYLIDISYFDENLAF